MEKRVAFRSRWLPYVLVAPQLAITIVFFFLPAGQAIWTSLLSQDPFGINVEFVGLDNFVALLHDEHYLASFKVTAVFSVLVAGLGLSISLVLAVFADRAMVGAGIYKTLLIWPYAVAHAVAAVLWLFLFNPTLGVVAHWIKGFGIAWDPLLRDRDAMILVVVAAVWNQISYNFLFFLAGLQSIPKSLIEAAAIDGAGPGRRRRSRRPLSAIWGSTGGPRGSTGSCTRSGSRPRRRRPGSSHRDRAAADPTRCRSPLSSGRRSRASG